MQEKQELDNKIRSSREKAAQLQDQFDAIEKLNIALFGDSELKNKFHSNAKFLRDKYCDETSATYVGENPVSTIYTDFLTRSIVIMVDPKAAPDGSNLPIETSVHGIPIKIEYGQVVRLDRQVIEC